MLSSWRCGASACACIGVAFAYDAIVLVIRRFYPCYGSSTTLLDALESWHWSVDMHVGLDRESRRDRAPGRSTEPPDLVDSGPGGQAFSARRNSRRRGWERNRGDTTER